MPLYEYLCGSCAHRFERIRKFSDPPLTECPACGGLVEKLISSPAIQFKGSGFYITDYAKTEKSGDSATKPPSSSASESSASDSKSDKSDKVEKVEKSEKSDKSDKPSASTETTALKPAATPEKK